MYHFLDLGMGQGELFRNYMEMTLLSPGPLPLGQGEGDPPLPSFCPLLTITQIIREERSYSLKNSWHRALIEESRKVVCGDKWKTTFSPWEMYAVAVRPK